MEFFIWEERLDTGIELIDEQHQRIAHCINALHAALERHDERSVGDTVLQLLDYTQTHLAFEEQLLEAANYPGFDEHKSTHGLFERRMHRYFKHHCEGKAVAIPLISELKLWLTTHILHEDMEYVPELRCYLEGKDSCEEVAQTAIVG